MFNVLLASLAKVGRHFPANYCGPRYEVVQADLAHLSRVLRYDPMKRNLMEILVSCIVYCESYQYLFFFCGRLGH